MTDGTASVSCSITFCCTHTFTCDGKMTKKSVGPAHAFGRPMPIFLSLSFCLFGRAGNETAQRYSPSSLLLLLSSIASSMGLSAEGPLV
eukprot:gene7309-5151_t